MAELSNISNDEILPSRFEGLGYTYKAKMHEEKVYNYLLENRHGATPDELKRKLKLHRSTVNNVLKRFLDLNLVIHDPRTHRYFIKDLDITFRRVYSNFFNDAIKILLNPFIISPKQEYESPLVNYGVIPPDSINIELAKSNMGYSPSSLICKSFAKENEIDDLRKCVFEFANRIGGFILYTFIESTRPNDRDNTIIKNDKIKEAKRRHKLARKFIHDSINIDMLYERFLNMISDMNYGVKSYDTKNKMSMSKRYSGQGDESRFMSISDFDKNQYEKLFDTFDKTYPKIYQGIEKYLEKKSFFFGYELGMFESMLKKPIPCEHDWKNVRIYRKNDATYHQCSKCHIIANDIIVKQLHERKLEQ